MKPQNFSHLTPHLKGKKHVLDPNLDLKHLVHHSTIQYLDRDVDGDVDKFDIRKMGIPDENVSSATKADTFSKKLMAKQKGEIKHSRQRIAYENYETKKNNNQKTTKKMSKNQNSDHEHSMARSELSAIESGVKRLKKKMKGEGNIEAWVQSKITRAADYIGSAADYLDSGEHNVGEEWKMPERIDPNTIRASKRSSSIRSRSLTKSTNPHEAEVAQSKRKEPKMPLVRPGDTKIKNINAEVEISLVDKILQEIEEEKKGLWANIHARRKAGKPRKKPGQKGYPETLDIEEGLKQARKNVGASRCWKNKKVDPNKPTKIKDGTEVPNCIPEATRIPAKTGNLIMATLTWKGKYHVIKMFFPSLKTPNRKDVQYELQKIYPGSRLNSFHVTEYTPDEPFIQVSEEKKKSE